MTYQQTTSLKTPVKNEGYFFLFYVFLFDKLLINTQFMTFYKSTFFLMSFGTVFLFTIISMVL